MPPVSASLGRRAAAEGLGSAFLLAALVGSGLMAERLPGGSAALSLLANSLATGAALVALILTFGPISGAHFNPAVSLAFAGRREMPWRDALAYVAAQGAGALAGVAAAHAMFDLPPLTASTRVRAGAPQLTGELVATLGLLSVVFGARGPAAPLAVGGYITAAYWFTSSTSFANPAVTFARAWTDSFAGIRPADVPGFVLAQLAGAALAAALFAWLTPSRRLEAP